MKLFQLNYDNYFKLTIFISQNASYHYFKDKLELGDLTKLVAR